MNKLAVTTFNDGTRDMVVSWDLIPSTKAIAGTTDVVLATAPDDFFQNFLDYHLVGVVLTKLVAPIGATQNRPITNTNYPFAVIRANSMDIFGNL